VTSAARTTSPRDALEARGQAHARRRVDLATRSLSLAIGTAAIAVVVRTALGGPGGRTETRVAPMPHRVDISSAPVEELALLPEVGARLAARIAVDRAVHGAFGSVDELARVGGFGAAKIDALRDAARAGVR
jgi:DNA uptake protein ComE-like DNA-binding protein